MSAIKIREDDKELIEVLQNTLGEYLIKPLSDETLHDAVNVLIAEIRKRSRNAQNRIYITENYFWDTAKKQLVYKDEVITLTRKEHALLSLLFSDVNKSFTYDIILQELWGEVNIAKQNSLKTLVKQLRQKLPINMIKNIFGVGYRVEFK